MTKISQEHEFTFTQPGLCKIKQQFWLYNQKHFNSLQISAINLKKKNLAPIIAHCNHLDAEQILIIDHLKFFYVAWK